MTENKFKELRMEAFENPDVQIFSRKGLEKFELHKKKAEEEYQEELKIKRKATKTKKKNKLESEV